MEMKSFRSVMTMGKADPKSVRIHEYDTLEFEEQLSVACTKYECSFDVVAIRDIIKDDSTKAKSTAGKKKKGSATPFSTTRRDEDDASLKSTATFTAYSENTIVIRTIYDYQSRLHEISLTKIRNIPRAVVQIIGLLSPFFPHLTKLTIRKCSMDSYTPFEISKFLPSTSITEINLDDSCLSQGNFALLLQTRSNLKNLSLSRCKINDVMCEDIFGSLDFFSPGGKHLQTLNLSSNSITDQGVKHIAKALRTNRILRYLNLADNRITDEGADLILDTLAEFPLTEEEVVAKRQRYFTYHKKKQQLTLSFLTEFANDLDPVKAVKRGKPSTPAKHAMISSNISKKDNLPQLSMRAEAMVLDMLGPFKDPFLESDLTVKDSWNYCKGNFTLAYLNLGYNSLSYNSLKKLTQVLVYQKNNLLISQTGLMKLVFDGNLLPEYCAEYSAISDLFIRNVSRYIGKKSSFGTKGKGQK